MLKKKRLFATAGILAGLVLVWPQTAYAHGGVDPGQNIWLAWNLTPEVVLGILLVGWLYVRGFRNWKHPHHPVNNWQKASFFLGLLAIFLALQSPIDPLAEHLFFMHQIQHLLLRMVGPILLFLGAPLTPLLRGLPAPVLQGAVKPVVRNRKARQLYSVLTHPLINPVLFIGILYFWQFPLFHNASIRNDLVHYIMHISMLVTGLFFWWLIIDPKPHRSRLHYGLRVLVIFLTTIPNTIMGAIITFSEGVLYTAYDEVGRLGGITAMRDEQIGGLILWVPGDMMNLIALAIVFFKWFAHEEAKQRAEEARLPQYADPDEKPH